MTKEDRIKALSDAVMKYCKQERDQSFESFILEEIERLKNVNE